MKPNQAVPYVQPDGRLNVSGMQLLADLGRVLPPRMTTTQRGSYDAQAGEIIFNTTTGKLNFWTGTAWEAVTSA